MKFKSSLLVGLMGYGLTWGAMGYLSVVHSAQAIQPDQISNTPSTQSIPNFSSIAPIQLKKTTFFEFLSPFINQSNTLILEQRQFVESLDFAHLTNLETKKVRQLIARYKLKSTAITPDTKVLLLRKIDLIPPSLALAQAANETAWGTSRFAQKGFNFFGQWCFSKGCGLVPLNRPNHLTHEVKTFNSPLESVISYMHTLNTHAAYQALRTKRYQARMQNQPLKGLILVAGLEPYSAQKKAYVHAITRLIRNNHLEAFDTKIFDVPPTSNTQF